MKNWAIDQSPEIFHLILYLIQILCSLIENITNFPVLEFYTILILVIAFYKATKQPYHSFYEFYISHGDYLKKICALSVFIVIVYGGITFIRSTLLIILIVPELIKNENEVNITVPEIHGDTSNSIFDSTFSSYEKYLNSESFGFFVCDKNLALIRSNIKGNKFMNELNMSFKDFTEKLIETQEQKSTLNDIITRLFDTENNEDNIKAEFSVFKETKENGLSSFMGELMCNYRIKMIKLNSNRIILIVKRKDQFSALILAKKLGKATIATLSHEFKTLLNAVLGSLSLLEDTIDKNHKQFYHFALSSAHILSSRLNDLFDYMQIQDRDFKLHVSEFLLRDLSTEISNICIWIAKQKNIKFVTDIKGEVPALVNADYARTRQVVLSLATKAIEYTDFGKIVFQIKQTKRHSLKLQIQSIGTGMHYKLMAQLKDCSPLERKMKIKAKNLLDLTENMEEMYLEISQLIIKEMNSKIIVKSTEKGKSKFYFEIPQILFTKMEKHYMPKRSFIKSMTSQHLLKPPERSKLESNQLLKYNDLDCILENHGEKRDIDDKYNQEMSIIQSDCSAHRDATESDVPIEHDYFEAMSSRVYLFEAKSYMAIRENKFKARMIDLTQYKDTNEEIKKEEENGPKNKVISKISNRMLRKMKTRQDKRRRTATEEGIDVGRVNKLLINLKKSMDDFGSCNILIVDDNMNNRFVLKALLKKCGYNSIEAQNGLDAVNLVQRFIKSGRLKEILLIFMDLQMPIMNGIESTKNIIEDCINAEVAIPPIIGVSSDYLEADRCQFISAGITEFVSKPLDKAKIETVINSYIVRSCL